MVKVPQTKFQIRLCVNNVIEKYELKYPLDIRLFVSILGFEVKYVDTGNADAFTVIINGKKLIMLNQNIKSKARVNFTLAHELGHYFIPSHLEPLYACNVNELVSTLCLDDPEDEREADIFASELLLPSKMIVKDSKIGEIKDILSVANRYNTSIPATAIRIIEHTSEIVCFICCKNKRISWFVASSGFTEYLNLKDIIRSPIPEFSYLKECIEKNIRNFKSKVPAFTWIEDVDDDLYIIEEILYNSKYDTGYILINAENLLSFDD